MSEKEQEQESLLPSSAHSINDQERGGGAEVDLSSALRPSKSRKMLQTIGYCLNFICLGIVIGELGACLPDLAFRAGVGFDMLAWIFTARSVGYLIGSGVIGYFMVRFDGAPLLIITLFFGGALTIFVPWYPQLEMVITIITIQGFFWGGVDTLGNCLMMELHGDESRPYVQALHFSFALGAFVSPLIVKPFISPHDIITHEITQKNPLFNWSFYIAATPVALALLLQIIIWSMKGFSTTKDMPAPEETLPLTLEENKPTLTDEMLQRTRTLKHVLSAPSMYAALKQRQASLKRLRSSTHLQRQTRLSTINNRDEPSTRSSSLFPGEPGSFKLLMVFLTSLFLFLYVGSEHGYQSWIYSYAVDKDGLATTSDIGAYLNSVFWGTFALGRLVAVPISIYLSPPLMMLIDLLGCMISLILLWVYPHDMSIFWLGTILLGLSMASVYPNAMNMCQTYIEVTGYAVTSFIFGSSVGQMLMPLVIGLLFERSPLWLIYVLFFISATANIVFWTMYEAGTTNKSSKYVKDKEKQKRKQEQEKEKEKEKQEQESTRWPASSSSSSSSSASSLSTLSTTATTTTTDDQINMKISLADSATANHAATEVEVHV
eukprot:TRINITY_DN158_c0_g1_i2.p1 TRINITY_DN158_c0_g1~~TRINITY_DN158_c0_g1_i2.p1  ORF type:complete len:604 (+),score=178.37 TRINITY_DN158_c0_g1_i2:46-1857(+)